MASAYEPYISGGIDIGASVPSPAQPYFMAAKLGKDIILGAKAERAAKKAQEEKIARARESLSGSLGRSQAQLALQAAGRDAATQAATAQAGARVGAGADEARNRLALELSRKGVLKSGGSLPTADVSGLNPYAAKRILGQERDLSQQGGDILAAGYQQKLAGSQAATAQSANLEAQAGRDLAGIEAGASPFDETYGPKAAENYATAATRGLGDLAGVLRARQNTGAGGTTASSVPFGANPPGINTSAAYNSRLGRQLPPAPRQPLRISAPPQPDWMKRSNSLRSGSISPR